MSQNLEDCRDCRRCTPHKTTRKFDKCDLKFYGIRYGEELASDFAILNRQYVCGVSAIYFQKRKNT